MSYKENMNWLLSSSAKQTSAEQRDNTSFAGYMANRSVEEGKFLQKISNSTADLIAKGHSQWRAGEQAKAVEDEYLKSVEWDPKSMEATTLKDTESAAVLSDIKNNELGVEARKEGVEPTLVNHYTGKSNAYLAQVAKIKLSKLSGTYEGWMQSQLINNNQQLTIPATATSPEVSFKINETSGLPNPSARAVAHKYLRQKFFKENLVGPSGDATFSKEFLNHSGFFKSITASDAKMGSKWRKESDIAHSARKRHLAQVVMGKEFSAENVDNYIKATANGVDNEGNFIGYEKSWDMFEDWIVDASQNYAIDAKDLARIANSKIPSDPQGRTYVQKWPSRFGAEGTIAQKLHKATKAKNTRDDEKEQFLGDKIVEEGWKEYLESDDKLSTAAEIRSRIIRQAPGYDISKWDQRVENKSSSAMVDHDRIQEVLQGFRNGELVDLSKDNYVVTSNEDVKKAKEHSERIKKSQNYKSHFDSWKDLLKRNDKTHGYTQGSSVRDTTGVTVQNELQQMFHRFALEEEAKKAEAEQANIKYEGLPTDNAAQRVKKVWLDNGGGDVTNTEGRYYMNAQNGSYPNIEREVKSNLLHNFNTKQEREDEFRAKVDMIGDGDVEDALTSNIAWMEPGGDNFNPATDTPPEAWNVNKYLSENNGKWPPYIYNAAQAMTRSPYQVANARQQALFGEEIPIEYNSTANRIIADSLPIKAQENARGGTASTLQMIENGKWIRNSIMESQGVDENEANNIFMRELFGPVGEEISFVSDDSFKNNLTMAALTEYLEISPTALDDFNEGSGQALFDAVNSRFEEGGDPHEFLTSPTSKMLMAQMSGDMSFLLRMPMYRDEIKSNTSQVEPTAEPQPSGLAGKVQAQGAPTGHPMATNKHQDPKGRQITYTNSIPKQHHGLQEGDTFTDTKGKKWVLIVTSGSGGTVTLGRKRSK